jgi:hypothetical protein
MLFKLNGFKNMEFWRSLKISLIVPKFDNKTLFNMVQQHGFITWNSKSNVASPHDKVKQLF